MVLYNFDAILLLVQLLHVRDLILIRPDIDVDDLDMLVDHLVSQRRHVSNDTHPSTLTHTHTYTRALWVVLHIRSNLNAVGQLDRYRSGKPCEQRVG